jgi:3-deoxy-D-manno-octulosonic-acid transferase
MWFLYQLAMATALLLAGPFLLAARGRHYLPTLRGRLGLVPPGPSAPSAADGRRPLWLHAVSVGEVGVAATLSRALPAELPLVVTTITPTGQARAESAFAGRARVGYLPFDLGFAVRRFLGQTAPAALVLVEGDLWPLLLATCRQRRLPIVVVNARVSDRSFARIGRYRQLLGPYLAATFARVDQWGAQSSVDRDRLLALGVTSERLRVTGNLKYESPEPVAKPAVEALITALAAGRPLLVAGSTMAGEEEAVLTAFAALGGGTRALLVLAPRHPERWPTVAALLDRQGLPWRRRGSTDASMAPDPAVVLLDSMGELAGLYRLATAAFVGGTLVPSGGHNPLEPARFGRPVAVGPSMENFRAMAEDFDRRQAWARVRNAVELAAAWREWLTDPVAAAEVGERGRALVVENRGAVAATVDLLADAGVLA